MKRRTQYGVTARNDFAVGIAVLRYLIISACKSAVMLRLSVRLLALKASTEAVGMVRSKTRDL